MGEIVVIYIDQPQSSLPAYLCLSGTLEPARTHAAHPPILPSLFLIYSTAPLPMTRI